MDSYNLVNPNTLQIPRVHGACSKRCDAQRQQGQEDRLGQVESANTIQRTRIFQVYSSSGEKEGVK